MANPDIIYCSVDEWNLVAENVTTGRIKKKSKRPNKYLETYRDTGDAAPTDITEGIPIFIDRNYETISSSTAIDVYIMAVGESGKVRVDLI